MKKKKPKFKSSNKGLENALNSIIDYIYPLYNRTIRGSGSILIDEDGYGNVTIHGKKTKGSSSSEPINWKISLTTSEESGGGKVYIYVGVGKINDIIPKIEGKSLTKTPKIELGTGDYGVYCKIDVDNTATITNLEIVAIDGYDNAPPKNSINYSGTSVHHVLLGTVTVKNEQEVFITQIETKPLRYRLYDHHLIWT